MADVGDVARRLDAGERVTDIAADLGVTPRTIRNRLHAAGLPLASTRSRQRRLGLLADPVWLTQQYVDDGRSASAIARTLELSMVDVRTALGGFGIVRPPARPHLTAEALAAAFAGGATVASIARTAGVDRATVRAALRRHGIENPHAARYRRPPELDDADWVRGRYIDDRLPIHAIADELGVAENTVARALRRHGVPPRRRADRPGGIDPDWLRSRYVDDQMTIVEVARVAGVSKSTAHRALVQHGLAHRAKP